MPSQHKVIRVLAASPGDVAEERQRLAQVFARLNDQLGDDTGKFVVPMMERWVRKNGP